MRPVLFLDIDGVLNTTYESMGTLDPRLIARLRYVVSASGCLVVLSSAWRKLYPLPQITDRLQQHGFVGHLFACTPALYEGRQTAPRGHEIAAWMALASIGPDRIAVVDDEPAGMGDLRSRLVQTDPNLGMTDTDAHKLVRLLKGS